MKVTLEPVVGNAVKLKIVFVGAMLEWRYSEKVLSELEGTNRPERLQQRLHQRQLQRRNLGQGRT